LTLQVEEREAGHPNRDRRAGYVPAVLYGHGIAPRAIRIRARAVQHALQHGGSHHLLQLMLPGEGEPRLAVIKEIQRHPVSQEIVHLDFQAVVAKERITAEVPLHLRGEDRLTKAGRILQVGLQQVRVSCLPHDLPDHIDVEIGELAPGHVLAVRDLVLPPGVTVLNEPDEVVASVVLPRVAEQSAPASS